MVVDYFNIFCVPVSPDEAHPPLVIDPDAVLAGAVISQGFQAVARRRTQVIQADCSVEITEFAASAGQNVGRESLGKLAPKYRRCALIPERHNHTRYVSRTAATHKENRLVSRYSYF